VANYDIHIAKSVLKSLKVLPTSDVKKIVAAIQSLALDPFPDGCRKLSGEKSTYRVRQGNYRVIYEIDGGKLRILILKVGHRKDVYKK
jgi:mRNA interferase RelE/StbE